MALISRVSRLLRADLHAVLDHLEEPQALLSQAVREMEEALASDTAHLQRLCREHEMAARREQELRLDLGNIDSELDLCFEAGEHDLARSLCRRKLHSEQQLQSVSRRREAVEREREAAQARCRERQLRFESIRQKAELFASEAAEDGGESATHATTSTIGDAVEVAFLREQRKRSSS